MAKKKVSGDCRLCLTSTAALQRSHIIPKFAYRAARYGETEPLVVTEISRQVGEPQARFTDAETTEHMLCRACEERFQVRESYVARLGARDGKMQILSLVKSESAVPHQSDQAQEMRNITCRSVDGRKIAYFALSILWRAAVSTHHQCANVELDSTHCETLRAYLLKGNARPPRGFAVAFGVIDDPDFEAFKMGQFPMRVPPDTLSAVGSFDAWEFILAGLTFTVAIGDLRTAIGKQCVTRSKTILKGPANTWTMIMRAADQEAHTTRRGRLGTMPQNK